MDKFTLTYNLKLKKMELANLKPLTLKTNSVKNSQLLEKIIIEQGINWIFKKLYYQMTKFPFLFTIDQRGGQMQWSLTGQLKQDWGEVCRTGQISAALSIDRKYLFILSKANALYNEEHNLFKQLDIQDFSLVSNQHESVGTDVQSFGLSLNCKWLYTAHKSGYIRQWDIKSKGLFKERKLESFRPSFLSHEMPITPDGTKQFVFNKFNKHLIKVRIRDFRILNVYDFSDSNFMNDGVIMKMTKDGKFLFTSDEDRICKQIMIENNEAFIGFYEHHVNGNIYCSKMALTPDGDYQFVALSTSNGCCLYKWLVKRRKILEIFKTIGGLREIEAIEVDNKGKYLYISGLSGDIGEVNLISHLYVFDIKRSLIIKNYGLITRDDIHVHRILLNL